MFDLGRLAQDIKCLAIIVPYSIIMELFFKEKKMDQFATSCTYGYKTAGIRFISCLVSTLSRQDVSP